MIVGEFDCGLIEQGELWIVYLFVRQAGRQELYYLPTVSWSVSAMSVWSLVSLDILVAERSKLKK